MKNIPFWQDDFKDNYNYKKLDKNIDVDILIIGGGITGCSTFYNFKDDKRKIVLVDRNKIGYGSSSRSSAKISYLQEDIYSKLLNNEGFEKAYLYYKSQKEALAKIKEVVKKENIDCDFKVSKSYLYTIKENNIYKVKREREILERFKEKTYDGKIPFNKEKILASFYVNNTYLFQPLKFIRTLASKSISNKHLIYENTTIVKISKTLDYYLCYTKDNLIIKSKYVVLALHYPYFLIPYFMPLKCSLEKSFIGLSKVKNTYSFNAINLDKPLLSVRYYHDYLLIVSNNKNLAYSFDNILEMHKFKANTNIMNLDYLFSNYDVMTMDNLPLIGFISKNLLLATGYNTWGNSNGFLAGVILKDLIDNKYNIYKDLFDPKRMLLTNKLISYPINIFNNSYSFIRSKINKNKVFYKGNPYFTKINGKDVAIYIDDKSLKHIVYTKCPHLKCSLIFNKLEKTWDCPCHGSRFTLDGNVIMGPSNYDITYKD